MLGASDERAVSGRASTGLGLTVSREIIRSLGGTIAFESEAGKGTIARVTLPPSRPPSSGPREPPSAEETNELPKTGET